LFRPRTCSHPVALVSQPVRGAMQILDDVVHEYRRQKNLADQALAQLDEAAMVRRLGERANPVAIIVKHLAGNFLSRWTDFLTSDGDKASRDRDSEFVLKEEDTRANLLATWEKGWAAFEGTAARLTEADLNKTITIRGEPHTVYQALLRG